MTWSSARAASAVRKAKSDDFVFLAKLADLDPGRDFRYANLSEMAFNQRSLSGFDFTGSDLSDSVFDGTPLDGANFGDAKLRQTRFYKANLGGANFDGADVRGAVFDNTQISEELWSAVAKGRYNAEPRRRILNLLALADVAASAGWLGRTERLLSVAHAMSGRQKFTQSRAVSSFYLSQILLRLHVENRVAPAEYRRGERLARQAVRHLRALRGPTDPWTIMAMLHVVQWLYLQEAFTDAMDWIERIFAETAQPRKKIYRRLRLIATALMEKHDPDRYRFFDLRLDVAPLLKQNRQEYRAIERQLKRQGLSFSLETDSDGFPTIEANLQAEPKLVRRAFEHISVQQWRLRPDAPPDDLLRNLVLEIWLFLNAEHSTSLFARDVFPSFVGQQWIRGSWPMDKDILWPSDDNVSQG